MPFGRGLRAPIFVFALCLCAASSVRAAGNFTITLDPGPNLAANPDAVAAFNRGANAWASQITSATPINIIINADFSSRLPSDEIAETTLIGNDLGFDTVRNAMAARAGPDTSILLALPTSTTIQVHTMNPNTFDNTKMFVWQANQKVLGLLNGTNSSPDGIINFNSTNFNFDYRGNVVSGFKTDFQTVATHEIGHVLGFDSTVDDYDASPSQVLDLMPLDLYRFSTSGIPTNAGDFTAAVRELAPGVNVVTSDTVSSYLVSTGAKLGDGNSPSHWKDDMLSGQNIGVMDPTIAQGQIYTVTDADLRAMQLLGYTLVPEPTTAVLLAFPCVLLLGRGKRR